MLRGLQTKCQSGEQRVLEVTKVVLLTKVPFIRYDSLVVLFKSINIDSDISLNKISRKQSIDHLLLVVHIKGSL